METDRLTPVTDPLDMPPLPTELLKNGLHAYLAEDSRPLRPTYLVDRHACPVAQLRSRYDTPALPGYPWWVWMEDDDHSHVLKNTELRPLYFKTPEDALDAASAALDGNPNYC